MPKIPADKILAKYKKAVNENWYDEDTKRANGIADYADRKFKEWGGRKYNHKWLHLELHKAKEWLELNWDRPRIQKQTDYVRFAKNWIRRAKEIDDANKESMGGHAHDRWKMQERDFQRVGDMVILAEIKKRSNQ